MTLYWVGNGGDWGDASHWSSSSGGAGGAGVPSTGDDVFFDANSFSLSGQIVTILGVGAFVPVCNNFDMSAVTHNPTLSFLGGDTAFNHNLVVFGNINIPAGVIATNGGFGNLRGIWFNTSNISILTTSFNADLIFSNFHFFGVAGTVNLTGNINSVRYFTNEINFGTNGSLRKITINTNNFDITATHLLFDRFNVSGNILNLGSSNINITNGDADVEFNTINPGTSTLNLSGNTNIVFTGSLNNINVLDTIGGAANIHHYATINNLTISPDSTVKFDGFATTTINGTFSANGTSGHLINLSSNSLGQQATISAAVASVSFCTIQDLAASGAGAPFDATNNCVDNGNNFNWSFPIPPSPYTLPKIITATDITFNAGQLQGDIPDFSTLNFNLAGLVFSNTNPLPTIFDSSLLIVPTPDPLIVKFGIIGPFYVNLTGLIEGQTYYVRAFGKVGTRYYYDPVVISFTVPARTPITLAGAANPSSPYRFELYDGSGNLLADLSSYIDNREFTLTRNRAEQIGFSIDLYTLNKLANDLSTDPKDLLKVGVNEVRVRRFGTVICAGQITYWSANLGASGQVIQVKAEGWLQLFSYRVFSGEYDSQDANYIIRDILTQTQALTNGNFGITLGSSVVGTNSYAQKIFENKSISDLIIEMSEEAGGFDFEFTWDKVFKMYHPVMGSSRPDILFTFPGNTKQLAISNDSTQIVNSLLARGKGNALANINTLISDAPSEVTYKLRTAVKDYPDMDADQLVEAATSELNYYKDPIVLRTINYDGRNPACPAVGSFGLGDRIRTLVKDLPLLSDFNQTLTIDSIHVVLNKDDDEDVQLSVNVPV